VREKFMSRFIITIDHLGKSQPEAGIWLIRGRLGKRSKHGFGIGRCKIGCPVILRLKSKDRADLETCKSVPSKNSICPSMIAPQEG
jgi:hypothetical protein